MRILFSRVINVQWISWGTNTVILDGHDIQFPKLQKKHIELMMIYY